MVLTNIRGRVCIDTSMACRITEFIQPTVFIIHAFRALTQAFVKYTDFCLTVTTKIPGRPALNLICGTLSLAICMIPADFPAITADFAIRTATDIITAIRQTLRPIHTDFAGTTADFSARATTVIATAIRQTMRSVHTDFPDITADFSVRTTANIITTIRPAKSPITDFIGMTADTITQDICPATCRLIHTFLSLRIAYLIGCAACPVTFGPLV